MKKLKAAVIGFGFMGVTHTKNILENPDVELVAIVDKNPANISKNLTEQAGNLSTGTFSPDKISEVRIYTSIEECLAAEELDVCVIAVHTNFHYAFTKLALEAGVDVFLEKPFCLHVSEGEELIQLARENSRLLMVGHVVRFMAPYQKLKQWIDSGEFGPLNFLSLTRFSGVPAWGQWKEKQQDFGSSGGALFDLMVHDIDFVQWALGAPDSIQATSLPGKLSRHDYINANWKYNSGLHAKIEGGNIFHAAFPFQAGFSASFEKASIAFSSASPDSITVATDEGTSMVAIDDSLDGYAAEMDYFVQCAKSRNKPEKCMPESALKAIELCNEIASNQN